MTVIRDRALSTYPKTRLPTWLDFRIEQGREIVTISNDRLRRKVAWLVDNAINSKAKPGVPMMAFGATNRDVRETHRDLVIQAVVARIKLLCTTPVRDIKNWTAQSLWRSGMCDPVRLFVKNEPHKCAKIKAGRERLISSVSLIDNLVERILYHEQNDVDIMSWKDIPSKPGMGLHDEAQNEICSYMTSEFNSRRRVDSAMETDMSGWDWSVQPWEMFMEVEVRAGLALGADVVRNVYRRALYNRAVCEMLCVFMLSDGTLIEQITPGKRCSGSYNTSCGNSRMRWMLSQWVGARWAITMGDDCVEEYIEDAQQKYDKTGHRVKYIKRCENGMFEFCSTLFNVTDGTGTPVGWGKTLYRFLSQKKLDMQLYVQIMRELRHSPPALLGQVDFVCQSVLVAGGGSAINAKEE